MRFEHPQKDSKQAGGNVVDSLGVMLRAKLYKVGPVHLREHLELLAWVRGHRENHPGVHLYPEVKRRRAFERSLGGSAQRRRKTQILQHSGKTWGECYKRVRGAV